MIHEYAIDYEKLICFIFPFLKKKLYIIYIFMYFFPFATTHILNLHGSLTHSEQRHCLPIKVWL